MRKFLIIATSLFLIGCENLPVNKGGQIGAVLGATTGGFVGYQFGGGYGQIIYTALGTAGGAVAGLMIGQRLDPTDRAEYMNTAERALGTDQDGTVASWSNPKTGNGGVFTPTHTYYGAEGQLCREFRATTAFDGGIHREQGTVCLDNAGRWNHVDGKVG